MLPGARFKTGANQSDFLGTANKLHALHTNHGLSREFKDG